MILDEKTHTFHLLSSCLSLLTSLGMESFRDLAIISLANACTCSYWAVLPSISECNFYKQKETIGLMRCWLVNHMWNACRAHAYYMSNACKTHVEPKYTLQTFTTVKHS